MKKSLTRTLVVLAITLSGAFTYGCQEDISDLQIEVPIESTDGNGTGGDSGSGSGGGSCPDCSTSGS